MDLICNAIKNRRHVTKNEKLDGQTWEQFYEAAEGKRLYLYGAGAAAGYLMRTCHALPDICGIVDSDVTKQGCTAGELIPEAGDTRFADLVIGSFSILQAAEGNDVVVLVTNTKNYEEIFESLRAQDVATFCFLPMEANARVKAGREEDCLYDRLSARDCCCRESLKREIVPNKIVFSMYQYGGHGRAITDALLKSNVNLDMVWLVDDLHMEAPDGVRLVYHRNWYRYIYEMETAGIWVFDETVPSFIVKKPGQIFIEVKHWSSVTLKAFYLEDHSVINTEDAIENVKYNGKIMDYIFSGSCLDEESCTRGFGFRGKFVRLGSARSDIMFAGQDIREKLYKQLGIGKHVKTVLYAPTFRTSYALEVKLEFDRLIEAVKYRFGGDWIVLLRLHPAQQNYGFSYNYSDGVIDLSDYPDSQELAAACDIMITDYSSIMFEPAFVYKPVFLFAPDRKRYVNRERNLLIDYDSLPFDIAETNDGLQQAVKDFDKTVYDDRLAAFFEHYGVHEDGHASERAARFILKLIMSEEIGEWE